MRRIGIRHNFLRMAVCLLPVLLFCPQVWAKDDLVIGTAQFPPSLHPEIDNIVIKSYALGFALRPITAFDKDWHKVCLLCVKLPTLENGLAKYEDLPDGSCGLAVTLQLRPDLKWGDGEPVTTQDLAFTWRVGSDPASGFSNTHPWNRANKIDIIDDHTAILHLDKPVATYNEWDQILPEHIEGPIYARAHNPGDYIKETAYNRAPTTPGLYNGPFLINSYHSGSSIGFEQNPYWPGPNPGFKRIELKLIENTAALLANLLAGDIDMPVGEVAGLTIDPESALNNLADSK
jgi:peptide/nickel transport system substrate-binding protein